MAENFIFKNLIAINFTNLNRQESLEVLDLRNDRNIRDFMLTNRKIGQKEHFRFIENLESASNRAYYALKLIDSKVESSMENKNIDKNAFNLLNVKSSQKIHFTQKVESNKMEYSLNANSKMDFKIDSMIFQKDLEDSIKPSIDSASKAKPILKAESKIVSSIDSSLKSSFNYPLDTNLDSSLNAFRDEILGVVCFNRIDLINKIAYFGIYANPKFRGIGSHLFEVLWRIAFSELNLRILFAEVLSTNKRALKFYYKHNFKYCGSLKDAVRRDNTFIDIEILTLHSKSMLESIH
ncbi:MAG: GNAT family N-acetyltransferase [Helicobacteraceae bacterium]|nr:GNAT family N-acetyltransferase [Helicobacteraceae bacterium]